MPPFAADSTRSRHVEVLPHALTCRPQRGLESTVRVTYHTESVAMTKPTVDALMDDVRQALAEVEQMLKAGADQAGEQLADRVDDTRVRAERTLHDAHERLSSLQDELSSRARRSVRDADRYVHDNPWQAIGIAAGLAFVVGLLVSRR